MGHNIFLLDISHLTEMDMVSFIKGEIVLSDNMEIPFSEPLEQLPQNDFPVQAGMSMVLFCLQGELHVRISLKEYTLRPDMFCVIITGMIFEVLSISNDFRGFMIATRTNFMPVTEKTTQVMSFYKCLQSRHCFVLEEKEVMAFVGVYHSIKATLQELDHPYRIPMLQSYVQILYYRMLPIVLKEEESRSKYSHTRQEEIFQRFIGEVEKHYRKERSVKFYADLLCISPKYLSTVIYKISQQLAGEWIDAYVILEAKALLKYSVMSIQEVAYFMNFPNPSFFGKYFKHHTGLSPSEYKMQ